MTRSCPASVRKAVNCAVTLSCGLLHWISHAQLVSRGDHAALKFRVLGAPPAPVQATVQQHAPPAPVQATVQHHEERIYSAHELGGCYLAWGTCCLVVPVLGAISCNTPKADDHYHTCAFLGLLPLLSTHWKRSHDNVWYAYEGGPDDRPGKRIECGTQRVVNPDCTICENGCFNGCHIRFG